MGKLRLEIEQLAVESFTTASKTSELGTVHGYGTFRGSTCGPEYTCGPQTCGDLHCVIETEFPCGDSAGCPAPTNPCPPPSGQLSCVGCTTYDYTNQGGDSCNLCLSFYTDSPERCPCI